MPRVTLVTLCQRMYRAIHVDHKGLLQSGRSGVYLQGHVSNTKAETKYIVSCCSATSVTVQSQRKGTLDHRKQCLHGHNTGRVACHSAVCLHLSYIKISDIQHGHNSNNHLQNLIPHKPSIFTIVPQLGIYCTR